MMQAPASLRHTSRSGFGTLAAGCLLCCLHAVEGVADPDDALPDTTPTAAALDESGADLRPPVSLTAYFENDGTFVRPGGTDRHYTSGQALSWVWHETGGDGIAEWLGVPADGTALGLVLGQQIFTPTDIKSGVADPNDRPFTGYLYLGTFWQREYEDVLDHVEIDLGITGENSLAENAQEWIHEITGDDDPDWSQQLDSEVAFNLTYRRKWRHDLGQSTLFDTPVDWQLIPRFELDVGTVRRRVGVGADLRVGVLPDDFGAGRFVDPAAATGAPVQGVSHYAFVRAVGRYVEWNTFIEGSNYRDPSAAVSLEPFVGELAGGFAVEWRRDHWVFNATYVQTLFTREFEEQDNADGLGSIALRAVYEF